MQDLGTTFKTLSYNASVALDQWSQILFDGKPDASGKTIMYALNIKLTRLKTTANARSEIILREVDSR